MRLKTVRIDVTNMNEAQEAKAIQAANHSLAFLASDFFKEKFLNEDLSKLRGESKSSISKRMSNQEIYELIQSGKEEWNDEIDYEIDLHVTRYSKWWSKVKGYIIPMVKYIYVNSKYFDIGKVFEIASNFCHELVHMFGFRHSGKWLRESLPYLVNLWFEEWYFRGDIEAPSEPEVSRKCVRVWWKLWLGFKCYTYVKKV